MLLKQLFVELVLSNPTGVSKAEKNHHYKGMPESPAWCLPAVGQDPACLDLFLGPTRLPAQY